MTDTLATGTGTASAGAGDPQGAGANSGQASSIGTDAPPPPAGAGAAPNGAAPGAGAPGASDTPWYAAVFTDPAVRQAVHTGGFKNADELGKSYIETKSLVGRKGVIVPDDKATPEQRAAALAQFGRPEKPEGYAIKYPEGYTPTELDKAYEADIRKEMFDAGTPGWLAERIAAAHMRQVEKVTKIAADAIAKDAEAGKAELAALETQWGPKAAANRALAQNAAQTLIPQDSPLYGKLESLLGTGPFVDLMYRMGTVMSEGGGVLKPGGNQHQFGPLTKDTAAAKIKEVRDAATNDPKHPYVNAQHPEHKAMQKQMMEWYAIAHPGMIQDA